MKVLETSLSVFLHLSPTLPILPLSVVIQYHVEDIFANEAIEEGLISKLYKQLM